MRTLNPALASVLLLCWTQSHALARSPKPHIEDAFRVERSELIVVAHLKPESITFVPLHDSGANRSEYHGTLVITEVLKGKSADSEIPITFHGELVPVVGGYVKTDFFMIDRRGSQREYPAGVIELVDVNDAPPQFFLAGGQDLRKDMLWLLRTKSGILGRKPGNERYGIFDPDDLQLLKWKEYFQSYLSADPEGAVPRYVQDHPEAATRAASYLDHLAVQRIMQIRDEAERFDKLLPYFLKRTRWGSGEEAESGIRRCKKVAGQGLRKPFDDPQHQKMRHKIIRIWQTIKYREAAPLLIDLLKEHDQFWAKQKLSERWWNMPERKHLRDVYTQDRAAIEALGSFKDPAARDALELTRRRWKEINFNAEPIVAVCDAALKRLEEK